MGEDIHIVEGSASEPVTKRTNATNVSRPTPIAEISPERGMFLRFRNEVPKGKEIGLPIFLDLRDANNNALPLSTRVVFQASVAGSEDAVAVSETLENINHYVSNTITEQRDPDNIDASKVTLQYPDSASKSGARPTLDIRDIDTLYISIESSVAVDWTNSKLFIATGAVSKEEY